jgi:hypothetical protein
MGELNWQLALIETLVVTALFPASDGHAAEFE